MARSARRSRGFVVASTFTVRPAITGVAQVGSTLTASNGTIVGGTFAGRQWRRDGVAIAGATGATYVPQAADINASLSVVVSVTLANGAAVSAASPPTAVVIA